MCALALHGLAAVQAANRLQPELTCVALVCAAIAFPHPQAASMVMLASAEAALRLLPEAAVCFCARDEHQFAMLDALRGLLALLQQHRHSSEHAAQLADSLAGTCSRAGLLDT